MYPNISSKISYFAIFMLMFIFGGHIFLGLDATIRKNNKVVKDRSIFFQIIIG
jgi:hypothetical protein